MFAGCAFILIYASLLIFPSFASMGILPVRLRLKSKKDHELIAAAGDSSVVSTRLSDASHSYVLPTNYNLLTRIIHKVAQRQVKPRPRTQARGGIAISRGIRDITLFSLTLRRLILLLSKMFMFLMTMLL